MEQEHRIEIDKELIKQDSIDLMKEIKSILDERNITFWLDQGTLLGAIRNGDFIPWDWDIDLSAWKSEFNPKDKLWDDFRNTGYYVFFLDKSQSVRLEKKKPTVGWRQVEIHFYDVKDNMAISYFYTFKKSALEKFLFRLIMFIVMVNELKSGPSISFKAIAKYLADISGNNATIVVPGLACGFSGIYRGLAKILSRLLSESLIISLKNMIYQVRLNLYADMLTVKTPYRYFSSFEERELLGSTYRVPGNVSEYLRFKFGEDWKTPKKDYDFIKEDGSLKHTGASS